MMKSLRDGVRRSFGWIVLLAAVALSCSVRAQDAEGEKPKPADTKDKETKQEKDPTVPSERLEKALQPADKIVPAKAVIRPPEIVLKALVHTDGKPPVAILAIGKTLLTVRDGALIHTTAENGAELTLTVKAVSEDGITIEVPGWKDPLIVK